MSTTVDNRSEIDKALFWVAADACKLLREWSDTDGVISPYRIGLFQQELIKTLAEVHFGTNAKLNELEK